MSSSSAIHVVRPLRTAGPYPTFVARSGVQFHVPAGLVRAMVSGVDVLARADMPLGTPYRVKVRSAPVGCGYDVGRDYTVRAACLELDPDAPPPPPEAALPAVAPPSQPARPMFLVAFMREGGHVPVQGTLLVMADTLEAASAAAMQQLTAELETDVIDRGESPDAMVLLLNAEQVAPLPAQAAGAQVMAAVTW